VPFRSSAIAQQSHFLLSPSPAQSNLAAADEFAMNFVYPNTKAASTLYAFALLERSAQQSLGHHPAAPFP
jgi:hypothetical protein